MKNYHICLLLLLIPLSGHASEQKAMNTKLPDISEKNITLDDYILGNKLDEKLKYLLGRSYAKFRENFQNVSVPTYLRSKGIFLTGYRNGSNKLTGALLILPDGRMYAAYYDNNTIHYFGPNGEDIPLPIHLWNTDLSDAYTLHFSNEQKNNILMHSSNSTPVSSHQKITLNYENFKKVMFSIWDAGFLTQQEIQINPGVATVISYAEKYIYDCSVKLGWNPQQYFPAGYYDSSALFRLIQNNPSQVTKANETLNANNRLKLCVNKAALDYKSDLILESIGG